MTAKPNMRQSEFAEMVDTLTKRGTPFAVATVVKIEGSSLGKPGFKVIISKAGDVIYGTLGGVCPESAIADSAIGTIRTGTPKIMKVYLENVENSVGAVLKSQTEDEVHVETNCGGTMEIYIEPYLPQQTIERQEGTVVGTEHVDTKARARKTMLLYAGYSEQEVEGIGDLSAMTSERFSDLVKMRYRRPGDPGGP